MRNFKIGESKIHSLLVVYDCLLPESLVKRGESYFENRTLESRILEMKVQALFKAAGSGRTQEGLDPPALVPPTGTHSSYENVVYAKKYPRYQVNLKKSIALHYKLIKLIKLFAFHF